MNGKTYTYLDIAALPGVGPLLLDPRPAFAFRADGSGIVWANAAGAAFFGEATMQALLARRFSPTSPLARHLALLAKQLSSDRPRLEILRFGFGSTETTLAAACQKLSLAGGANAVLIIAANNPTRESLATRAERLADAIADADCLAAVLDSDGKVLGASGGFAALAPAEEAIDRLIEDADRSDRRLAKRELRVGDMTRPAGAARVVAGNERFFLLIVGPEESNPRAVVPAVLVAAEPVKVAQDEPMPTSPDTATATDVVAEPAPAERVRFFWQLNAELRFSFVSDTLGAVVGPGHAPVAGMAWADVAAGLALDPSGAVAEALARRTSWSGIAVYWPVEGAAERIVVELSAVPSIAADRSFAGYRGFGVALPGDRRPDERPFPGLAAPAAPLEEAAPAAVEDSAPAPAALPPTEPLPPIAVQAEPPEVLPEAPARPIPPPSGTPATEVDIDDVARKSIEQGTLTRPADRPPPTHEPPAIIQYADPRQPGSAVSNVVRLPGTPTRALPRRLTGTEQDAFRRIAEALGARTADEAAAAASTARTEPPADRPEFDERLLDRLPVGLVVHRDGRTLFANRAALDLLGYASLGAFRAAGGAEAILPAGALPAPGGDGMLDVLRADGSRALVAARLHAVTWSGSTALMLSLMEREPPLPSPAPKDEAPPEPTPAAARIAELETILDTATDGVIVIDETGRIATINRSAEALFGIAAGEVRGRPFTELLAEESRRAALDYLDGLASNGVASVLNDGREVIGKVPAGGLIPLFMTMGRLGDSGKYCAVLRDITHWKNVEEELVAARRAAETANAQKSDFLAKISHEIRTPLNAIIGFSEVMMEERFGPVGNDRYRAYLRDIHLSGEHLMSLINDLLDLSKIEAGKLELKSEAVLVNEVIQECVALMQPQANRERIIIRTSLAADVPPVVADLRSFRQILLNLLSNAVKFTRAGGQVIVATALEESGEVVVRIRDTGIGMSDKEMETAMKPFRQIATSGRAREGTGLGLPLTKALVEANRAAFSIDSVPNQGTLVRVTFPTTRVLAG